MKILFFLFLFLNKINIGEGKGKDFKTLKSDIYNNYNDINNDGINLTLSLAVRAFNNIDQIDGSIEMNVWLRYEWNDTTIGWDPTEYNISSINLDTNPDYDDYIWTPDIYLYNTAEKPMSELDYTKANVYSDGRIFWSRPGLIKSTCVFDLTHFPFDQQECKLKFGSWSYDNTKICLVNTNHSIDIKNYQEHEEWHLITYRTVINSIKYECCDNKYDDIEFYYTIRRKPDYYNLNIIVPTFATATLIILTLIVPWNSGERISFAVTVLLSIIVFLLIVSENLPKTDNKPLLSRMIIGLIYFSLVGVTFTVIISSVHNHIDNESFVKNKWFIKLFSKCQCTKKKLIKSITRNTSYTEAINNETKEINIKECQKILYKIELLFIFLFFISFIIYCLVIFLNIPNY